MLGIRVILLDETITIIQAQRQALSRIVFNEIIKQLNVLESDYFGLEYSETGTGTTYWLDLDKKLSRQVGFNLNEPVLKFCVKFYAPDPSLLEEEFTRFLFSLQIKHDLINGDLVCNDNTAALLISYLIQAECGDWNEDDYPDPTYLKAYKFVANQDSEMEERIRDNHKRHLGQSPSDADLHLLETARRTEFYGLKFQHVKDESGILPNLRITSSCNGILVYQNNIKLSHYSWSKIRKLSFKRKKFLIKLYKDFYGPECSTSQTTESIIEYIFPDRNSCKSFWKKCIEIYSFFKLNVNEDKVKSRSKSLLSARGSSFRYTGRTQKEMINFLRDNFMKRSNGAVKRTEMDKAFGRSSSMRSASVSHHHFEENSVGTAHHSHSNVSTSYSSPGNMQKSSTTRNDSDSAEDEEEDETLSPSGTLSPAPLSPDHQGQQEGDRLPDPDWFFYLLRELVNVQRNLVNHLNNVEDSIVVGLSTQLLKLLEMNLECIPRQIWELANGINLVRILLKFFQSHSNTYLNSLLSITLNDSFIESSYNKLSLIYYFTYLHTQFCKIILTHASLTPTYTTLISLANQLSTLIHPLGVAANDITSKLENQLKVTEVMKEINDIPNDTQLGHLIRLGILMKFNSKQGLENRIFVLTRNYLLYGSRVSSAVGFRLHGLLHLLTLKLESTHQTELPNSFSINASGKIILLSAFTENLRDCWIRDLDLGIRRAEPLCSSPSTINPSDSVPKVSKEVGPKPLTNWRLNNMLHVCWHRNLSISFTHISHVSKFTISGYLLRKFKNSAGWQKLFVAFNHVCLFFYKSHEDKVPLATLPILGYKVDTPGREEGITKEFVFKITFKNHIYYFRTESPFTFKRWIYVLSQATTTSLPSSLI